MKIRVVFYSTYGHVWKMAQAEAEGAREVKGVEVELFQVPELVPEDVLVRTGAKAAREAFAHVPVATPDTLAEADGILFGTPTRFGNMTAQMKNLIDRCGQLWMQDKLVGKVAGVFSSTATQHGGQETTAFTMFAPLLHLGMIIVGVPYSEKRILEMGEITGGSPYGASTMAGGDGSRQPTENELAVARFQGRYVAEVTAALVKGRGKG